MFCARLDMTVDDPDGGAALVVSEVIDFGLRLGFEFSGFGDIFRFQSLSIRLVPGMRTRMKSGSSDDFVPNLYQSCCTNIRL
jgi:hypothetical protein